MTARRGSDAQERWLRLSSLYDAGSAVPRAEREAWVAAQCPDDAAMREELLRMFEAGDVTGPLDAPPHPLPEAHAPITERLGAALAGRYRLIDEIAQGGMGAVYRAHELKHGRDVILKVLRPDIGISGGQARFESEVRIAARLAHPHIVPLLDSGDAGGLLYFVMPHLPGETLRERIDRLGALPVPDAIKLMRDIADALMHAHEHGVVHRDLKPENILCSGEHAFLLDFGIAQYARADDEDGGRLTLEGNAVGTPRYMAPEQAAGHAVDHRADLFAWGIVANEMLFGSRRGDLAAATRSDVPEALSALIFRCLSPDPSRRPRSAGTLVAALDALASHGAKPSPATRPIVIKRRRWPFLLYGAAAAVVIALVWRGTIASDAVPADTLRMPIAVLPFREDGDATADGVRGRLAGAWITQGLHETGVVQVVPWTEVLQAVDGSAEPEAALLRRSVVGTVVSGTFFTTPEGTTLHAEIRAVRNGRLLASLEPVPVPRDSAAQAIRIVRDRVMGALAITRDARFAATAARHERPPTFESYRAFDRALTQFLAQQYRPALAGFREAFALDDGFIAPLLYAAQAAWNTSQYAVVDTLLGVLDARRAELTDYHEHLRVQLRAMMAGDGRAAYAAAARAAALAPDSRAAYDAAVIALWLGWNDSARVRLETMSPDRGAMIGWPSYWTNLAHARHLTGDHVAERRAAREMRARHPALRVAWVLEARALAALRDFAALDALLAEAEALEQDVYWSYGGMLVVAGEELAAHGDTVRAAQYATRAREWLERRLRLRPTQPDHLFWLASAAQVLGDFAAERRAYERLVQVDARLRNREALALAAERTGTVGALARVPQPEPNDIGSRYVTEARLAGLRGDAARREESLREVDRVGFRGRPWLHGAAWRDLGASPP